VGSKTGTTDNGGWWDLMFFVVGILDNKRVLTGLIEANKRIFVNQFLFKKTTEFVRSPQKPVSRGFHRQCGACKAALIVNSCFLA
jgi:hypothetical protein